jgi:uncharacterized protein
MKRYLVLAMRKPNFDIAVVPAHNVFLDALRAEQRLELSGPFTDKSGGAYLLRADSLDEAIAIAHRDPLHVEDVSAITVHEWNAA